MIICDSKKCTGCGACFNVCPLQCITMQYSNDGFLHPSISEKCIKCKKCSLVCPENNTIINVNYEAPTVIACHSKKNDIVMTSSSGGAFSEIARNIISKNGLIFGASFDKELNLYHSSSSDMDGISSMKGSKYIQSDTGNTFAIVKEKLLSNIFVLYTGTPCQIAGLKSFLKVDYPNLITCDLVCHGVGSKKIFDSWIDILEKRYNSKVSGFSFRNKDIEKNNPYGSCKVSLIDGRVKYIKHSDDYFYNCFIKCAIYRESCYSCKFANIPRVADITLGDFRGVDKKVITSNQYKNGISMMMINSKKGIDLFNEISSNIYYHEEEINNAIQFNKNISSPSNRPYCRDLIFNDEQPLYKIRNLYCRPSRKQKFVEFLGPTFSAPIYKLYNIIKRGGTNDKE